MTSAAKLMEFNAAQAIKWMRGPDYEIELPLSETGVRWLEDVPQWSDDGGTNGILEEMTMTKFLFEGADPLQRIATLFGSYLGEVIRLTCGGKWLSIRDQSADSVVLQVGEIKLFPHQKVMKRLLELDGGEDEGKHNIWDYFQVTRDLCRKTQPKSSGLDKVKQVGKRPTAPRAKRSKRRRDHADDNAAQDPAANRPRE